MEVELTFRVPKGVAGAPAKLGAGVPLDVLGNPAAPTLELAAGGPGLRRRQLVQG